jgi:hypothetical protein
MRACLFTLTFVSAVSAVALPEFEHFSFPTSFPIPIPTVLPTLLPPSLPISIPAYSTPTAAPAVRISKRSENNPECYFAASSNVEVAKAAFAFAGLVPQLIPSFHPSILVEATHDIVQAEGQDALSETGKY